MDQVRKASSEDLETLFISRLKRMIAFGTTLVEGKSGYGLNWDTEFKMLKVLHNVGDKMKGKIDIVSNYCGAHSIPKESSVESYTKEIIEHHIPLLKNAVEEKQISPELIDVFCEKGVFGTEESRKILQAGFKDAGLHANFHGDELNPLNSAEMGANLDSCMGISHLEHISEEGIKALAEKRIPGILLPTTAYILRIAPPPARKMIDNGY